MKRLVLFLFLTQTCVLHAQQRHDDTVDDILQYSPYAAVAILKACGVGSRDTWGKTVMAAVASWTVSAGVGYALKHTVKETRPDGTDRKSFPSGHAIIAFAGATNLHKEFGGRSPWISVAGYSMATYVAVSRVIHDRHHWYDVAAGAGIGILGTEAGWWLTEKLLHQKKGNIAMGFSGNTLDVCVRW